jgi:hypothetical protein
MLTIKNWQIVKLGDNFVLEGNVTGHKNPSIMDGMFVSTSKLISIDFQNKKAQTQNSIYILDTPK